ncbi:AAA family ATPase [Flavobacterium sp. C4GT6]|uniref:AAA family ATPase n=1 Tax=Flavobacterium sp. C4GT6 TaxID=3103818 RepID=UPI002ED0C3AF
MKQPYHLTFEDSQSFKDYSLNDENEPITYLPNFNTINIIVGANNSGKSRFMRSLMRIRKITRVNKESFEKYNDIVEEFNLLLAEKYIDFNENQSLKRLTSDFTIFHNIRRNSKVLSGSSRYAFAYSFSNNIVPLQDDMTDELNVIKIYYIPTLRTAHSLYSATKEATSNPNYIKTTYQRLDEDVYLETLRKNYSLDNKLDVFTGMDLYEQVLNSRNAEKNVRERFELFENFLSKNFFDGKQIDIVAKFNKSDSKQGKTDSELILIHVEGEKQTRKLHDLGDGIQALIILMYKIFMAEDNSFFFIDEPELNLHPGMQRLFLEQIATNPELLKKKLTYIISTHSNHFLDLTLEKDNVSIYSFAPKQSVKGKDNQFIIKNVNRGDNELLKHLGVNNSSVFLANCSIWVEGVSDRNYIKAFLRSYIDYLAKNEDEEYKSLKEDIDYTFFEYAGSNIEHYLFENEINKEDEEVINKEINALALSNKIFLLADSDNAKKTTKKGVRLKKLEDLATDNLKPHIIWEVREIENLLTNKVWEKVLINFCNKKLLSEHREDILNKISEALKIVNSDDYKKEYIGVFLNEIDKEIGKIDGVNVLNKIYKENEGVFGTLIPKSDLSKYILEANFDWENLQESKEIKQLTEDVYKFIIDSMN